MSIEVSGGKHAYAVVHHAVASRQVGIKVDNYHSYACQILVADSEDEAFGRATRIAERMFPGANGWGYRHSTVVQIDHIDTARRIEDREVDPIPDPFGEG